ncbi:3002_t:CDS:2 [Acaulospora morrowiae]|uniref:3002_t:CDS:1 n=1 Tax=Acaulospora morrowiae TaxID=94023 RepID=A0A9N8V3S8_9GLOM|nr:3002_t:CDS:2 [Acaulospora morrowiae]
MGVDKRKDVSNSDSESKGLKVDKEKSTMKLKPNSSGSKRRRLDSRDEEEPKSLSNVNNGFKKRCWDPCNIYIFGAPGTRKTFWTNIVFPNAYKKSMDDNWENYNNDHIIVINEIERGSASQTNLLNILDRAPIKIQVKGSSLDYVGMYQVLISNTGLRELYDYDGDIPYYERFYRAIERRFNFIIEYRKIRNDSVRVCNVECTCCRIQRIFHKGSREKFQKLEFDIEFDEKITRDCALEIVRKLNREGKLLQLDNKIIWREDFNDDNRYMVRDGDELHLDFIVYSEILVQDLICEEISSFANDQLVALTEHIMKRVWNNKVLKYSTSFRTYIEETLNGLYITRMELCAALFYLVK